MSTERSRLLSSPLAQQARAAGLSEAEIVGLAQAYTRGIGRIVAAEVHILGRARAQVPPARREQWTERWLARMMPLAVPAFEAFHGAQLETAVRALVTASSRAEPAELAVSFVDLCGSTEYMLGGSRDDIRALVDGVFYASSEVTARHNVVVSKHLGDGVLLVSPNRDEMLVAVIELIAELGRSTPLRAAAGVDFGNVTTRAGDHFGPPVNLASRLAEVAPAGEALVSVAATPEPPPAGVWETHSVRGLAQPQRVLRTH